MIQTGHWNREEQLDKDRLLQLLREKFSTVDFEWAKQDIRPFIKDPQELALWRSEFFLDIIEAVEII